MSDIKVGIAPTIREELSKAAVVSVVLTKDASGIITGGTITYADGHTTEITVTTSE